MSLRYCAIFAGTVIGKYKSVTEKKIKHAQDAFQNFKNYRNKYIICAVVDTFVPLPSRMHRLLIINANVFAYFDIRADILTV